MDDDTTKLRQLKAVSWKRRGEKKTSSLFSYRSPPWQYYDQGLIEEDEYNEQKAALLDRILNKPVRASAVAAPRASAKPQQPRATQQPQPQQQPPRASAQVAPKQTSPARASQMPAAARASVQQSPGKGELGARKPRERAPDECWPCGERLYGKLRC